jgi:parallel beta-helix repeat protein
LFDNRISNNKRGINLGHSQDINVIKNIISYNTEYGVRLNDSINNYIYFNSLVENQENAYTFNSSSAVWNNTYDMGGGNYWSNFDQAEEGAYDNYSGDTQQDGPGNPDGIVDNLSGGLNPYIIHDDDVGQDWYPSKYPYAPVTNLNSGLTFSNITAAIEDESTQNGHRIIVKPGIYYENITIDKSIELIGWDPYTTIIDGKEVGYANAVIEITVDEVVLRGFTIQSGNIWNGIQITSDNNTINNNIIQNMDAFDSYDYKNGIFLWGTRYNKIYDNTIVNDCIGIFLLCSWYNNIYGNNISNNNLSGIRLHMAGANTITMNHMINNSYCYNSTSFTVNNLIYHNTLINNSKVYDSGNNKWNATYPIGGNYWDDYNGTDGDGDGIGDTAHEIPPQWNDLKDHYPLMEPYPRYPVMNLDTEKGFYSIQDAIDYHTTTSPHTIYVERGIYHENLVIDKSINLIGANKDYTIIDGSGTEDTITIQANGVSINGFTIQNSGSSSNDAGINVQSSYNTITENIITNNPKNGIYLSTSAHDNIISDNIFQENDHYGISLTESSENAITNNDLTGCQISLSWNCDNNEIIENTIHDSNFGIQLSGDNDYNTISENILNNLVWGIFLNWGDDNNIISDNILNNGGNAICIYSSHNDIVGNNLNNNSRGIWTLSTASNNDIHDNYVTYHAGQSMFLNGSHTNVYRNSIINDNDGTGLLVHGKHHNIYDNSIENSEDGISLSRNHNYLENNEIVDSQQYGILITS